ncbi:hypothetical protein COEREDRAFT_9690 [Coemansia reversa NRRL 1564]|uniref:Mid2 domain-containing protein n=1 Tax=Coemansia reversa (strain ATCC 12441 / NRRL 1564) TaxID=763665 RepID=A0A2G5B8K0_COERN|nr:hypothetical protein COEREDRAFT_9690 [Coemansia reversa NRRL 1564]|eukprot:PIA15057.1 hypothetical protein COEREDRAFT_9690 [Coemansia reversa NRRL 1564]
MHSAGARLCIVLFTLFVLAFADTTSRLTIDCNVLGERGCAEVRAIALAINQGKTVGPVTMEGNTGKIVAIVVVVTSVTILLLVGIVMFSWRRMIQKGGRFYDDNMSDDLEDTAVNTPLSTTYSKTQYAKEDEVLFRLSASPF